MKATFADPRGHQSLPRKRNRASGSREERGGEKGRRVKDILEEQGVQALAREDHMMISGGSRGLCREGMHGSGGSQGFFGLPGDGQGTGLRDGPSVSPSFFYAPREGADLIKGPRFLQSCGSWLG